MNGSPDALHLIPEVEERLAHYFGEPEVPHRDPVEELVRTILSQNTNDRNRDLAFYRLRQRFPTWIEILKASEEELFETIKPAGLGNQKAKRIKEVLEWISRQTGSFSLDFIKSLTDQEALTALSSLKGVGIKTAGVVLAFAFGRDLCPVDTHINRIAHRLHWVLNKTNPEKVFWTIKPHIPVGRARQFHLNLLKLGRTICTARLPKCYICPLATLCPWEMKTQNDKGAPL